MRGFRKLISRSGLFFFGLVGFCYCLSLLATKISPSTFWPLAYFGLLFPFFLLAIFLFFLYWLFRKKRKVILPILLIAIGWPVINSLLGFSIFSAKEKDTDHKIMTYNVRNFGVYEGKNIQVKKKQLQLINELGPNILCFQEFYTSPKFNPLPQLQETLDKPFIYFEPGIEIEDNRKFGVAILADYPLYNNRLIFHDKGNLAIQSDVIIESDTLRIINVHLASIHLDAKDKAYINDLKETGTKATSKSKSKAIFKKLKSGFITRSTQVDSIKAKIKESPYPVIVAGDFNDIPNSYTYRKVRKGLQDAFTKTKIGLGHTHNGILPLLRIDHILASKDIIISKHSIIRKDYSDHYPVITSFRLKKSEQKK